MGDKSAISGKIRKNCIGLRLRYLKWDTTTTTKVDQSNPYPLHKISNNNNNNNDDNSKDNKAEEIVLPRILQYSFLSIV